MDILRSPLWDDIADIVNVGEYNGAKYSIMLHTPDDSHEEGDYPAFKLISIDIERDYVHNYADVITVKCHIPLGEYIKRIRPSGHQTDQNLEASLFIKTDVDEFVIRYKAIIPTQDINDIDHDLLDGYDEESLDSQDVHLAVFQLVDTVVEPLPRLVIDGVYDGVTRGDILTYGIETITKNLVVTGRSPIDKVDLTQPNNMERVSNLVIPTGTKLLNLANYLQNEQGGIYTGGIHNYIQTRNRKAIWYIYPPYDTTRYNDREEKLIVYLLPGKYPDEYDRTVVTEGNITRILASSHTSSLDAQDRPSNKLPLGFRINNADEVLNRPHKVKPGKDIVGTRGTVSKKYLSRHSLDSLDIVSEASTVITNNIYVPASAISKTDGTRMDIIWNKSDPTRLRPGMSVKIYREHNDKILEMDATLLFNHTLYAIPGKGGLSDEYRTKTMMTLFVDNDVKEL